jgi:hypothetical protein
MATPQKTDWVSFLQLTSESSEGLVLDPGKVTPVAEITERAALQLPTPTSELNVRGTIDQPDFSVPFTLTCAFRSSI